MTFFIIFGSWHVGFLKVVQYFPRVFGLPSYLVHQRTHRVHKWSTLRTYLRVWMRSFYEISKKMSEKLHLIFFDLLSNDQKIKGTSNEDQCRSGLIIFLHHDASNTSNSQWHLSVEFKIVYFKNLLFHILSICCS